MCPSLWSIRWRLTNNAILNGGRLAYIEIMARANKSTEQETQDKRLYYLPIEGVTIEATSLEEAQALAREMVEAQKDEKVGDDSI